MKNFEGYDWAELYERIATGTTTKKDKDIIKTCRVWLKKHIGLYDYYQAIMGGTI